MMCLLYCQSDGTLMKAVESENGGVFPKASLVKLTMVANSTELYWLTKELATFWETLLRVTQ